MNENFENRKDDGDNEFQLPPLPEKEVEFGAYFADLRRIIESDKSTVDDDLHRLGSLD